MTSLGLWRVVLPVGVRRVLAVCAVLSLCAVLPAGAQEAPGAGGGEAGARPPVEVRGQIELRPELTELNGVSGWRVNGEEISLEEVRERAILLHGPYILQDLVSAALLHQEAARRNITVTDEEVETEIGVLREELGLRSDDALEFHLRQRRLTREGFREQAGEYLLLAKTLADKVYVSDKDIERFYNQYRGALYFRRARVEFRIMSFPTEAAALGAKQQLARGSAFVELAREVAREQGGGTAELAVAGGLHGYEQGQRPPFPPEFEAVLFAAPLNQVVGPIESLGRYHLVKVEKKTDPYQIQLEEVRNDIRLMLRRRKLEQVVWPQWIAEQLSQAQIEVIKGEGLRAAE